ncbi:ATP-NAD kinase-like domain-containing protein [Kockovaella imperatae]|uniref:ATP-NAD kinase-like domain-containing protein n=1 Tax=Kockovaella imperatae TaxID=4999 RepID=A0A1Y1URH1_9TREE|nr:ATP-NAD kinase-like domain-containing protein [Kockovaella imperatae]ORX40559.1 ATP-NAD kinase-like domain-containing protein [Kockovaella imperatae]
MGGAIDDEDDEEGGSLTRQLAETAQGVREMSKELGRTRVRSRIQHVLIVTKARDNRLIKLTRELALYLMQKRPTSSPDGASRNGDRGMIVYVDAQLEHSKRFDAEGLERDYPELFKPISSRRASSSGTSSLSAFPSSSSVSEMERQKTDGQSQGQGQLRYWTAELCSSQSNLFDFVVTLGGDGTVLFTSWLFQRIVPPVLPFALGSLGFLTNFDFAKYKETMDRVVDDGIRVNLRMRFTCTVYRAIAPEDAAAADGQGRVRKAIKKSGGGIMMSRVEKNGWDSLEAPYGLSEDCRGCVGKDKEIMCFSTRPVEQFEVLNDLVVDRGPSPFVSLLELFGDEQHLTTVQADGLTVSTPTGSTAYSLSAGGSLVHPQIPALLITPICPHTLSFRPMLLPDSMELRICVPYNSRSTAWASFDGRGRVELKQGDHIKVTASKYPFPTVCADKASTDWFSAISRTLRWNEREKQKSFVVVEEDGEPSATQEHGSKHQHGPSRDGAKSKIPAHQGIAEEEEEDEEDEQFDIDDKSSGDATNPSSPHISATNPKHPLDRLKQIESPMKHVDGVSSPDRYVTKCDAPPPLSQRHLMRALAAAEINAKEGEVGDRDEIRAGSSNQRLDGNGHMIPSGRSPVASPSMALADMRNGVADLKTPRASHRHQHQHQQHHSHSHNHQHHPTTIGHSPQHHSSSRKPPPPKRQDSRAKAFAFFGQDDSASDMSDRSE